MHYTLRKIRDYTFTVVCFAAFTLASLILLSILWTLLSNGIAGILQSGFFTETTPAPGMHGGLANAIIGSLILTGIAITIATPCGLLIAVYISEFSTGKRAARYIRFANDILLSTPSIVIGLFCYVVLVKPMHNFSVIAGSIALAIIALPIIVRTSEVVLTATPNNLRESAVALGVPYWSILIKVIMKSVYQGLVTGVILAFARILGETAPLLFTSLNNQFWSFSLNKPIASLPVVIYQYAMSPYLDWQSLAWGGALLITLISASLSLLSRFFVKVKKR